MIDSLIFNLYSKHKAHDKTKIHNSLYQASLGSVNYGSNAYGSGKYGESGAFSGSLANIQISEVNSFM